MFRLLVLRGALFVLFVLRFVLLAFVGVFVFRGAAVFVVAGGAVVVLVVYHAIRGAGARSRP